MELDMDFIKENCETVGELKERIDEAREASADLYRKYEYGN